MTSSHELPPPPVDVQNVRKTSIKRFSPEELRTNAERFCNRLYVASLLSFNIAFSLLPATFFAAFVYAINMTT